VRKGTCLPSMLTVIKEKSPTTFAVEQNLTRLPGARTMTPDGKTGRILLIAAEYNPPPMPPQPGGRGGRGLMVPDLFLVLLVSK
jgi:hypothetical protein